MSNFGVSILGGKHAGGAPGAVALRELAIRGRVSLGGQRITICQTYYNSGNVPLEVVYTFPLNSSAAVCGFEAALDSRTYTARLTETEKALEQYDRSVRAGDGAYLLQQHRGDVFSVSLGSLVPGQTVTTRLTYVMPLDVRDATAELVFPTVVGPRYVPQPPTDADALDRLDAALDDDTVNPPIDPAAGYRLSLDLELSDDIRVSEVDSPTHGLCVTHKGGGEGWRVGLQAGTTAADGDIVIRLELVAAVTPCSVAARGPAGRHVAAVSLVPDFEHLPPVPESGAPRDYLFLIDRSGSMGGNKFARAVQAVRTCVRNLREGDWFNLCSFASDYTTAFPQAVRYEVGTFNTAMAWLNQQRADGGTELSGSLAALLDQPVAAGRRREIILISDGQVGNEDRVVALASRARDRSRFFTIGIGSSVSRSLMQRLAEATAGAAEFVVDDGEITDLVIRQFERIAAPRADLVAVEWKNAGAVVVADPELRAVFEGDAIWLAAECEHPPTSVDLTVRVGEQVMVWRVGCSVIADDGFTASLWARNRLACLRASGMQNSQIRRQIREQMVAVSLQYSVMCEHTSFVAIETRADDGKCLTHPVHHRIPVLPPRDAFTVRPQVSLDDPSAHVGLVAAPVRARKLETKIAAPGHLRDLLGLQRNDGAFEKLPRGAIFDPKSIRPEVEAALAKLSALESMGRRERAVIRTTIAALIVIHAVICRPLDEDVQRSADRAVAYLASSLGCSRVTVRRIIVKSAKQVCRRIPDFGAPF